MEEQFVWIGDILDIQEFDLGIGLRIEVLVHILQHILNANLFAIADAPHTVELQAFDDSTLQDEHRRRTRAADEVNPLRIQVWDREGEHTMVIAVQQTNAVRTDQGSPILFTGIQDALFEQRALMRLLTEACRDNHKRPDTLLTTEVFDIVGTEPRSHHKHSQIRLWQILHIVTGFDTLHVVFLRVDDVEFSLITAIDDVSDDCTTRLVHIIRAANHDDTPWIEQLFVYHRCKDNIIIHNFQMKFK